MGEQILSLYQSFDKLVCKHWECPPLVVSVHSLKPSTVSTEKHTSTEVY